MNSPYFNLAENINKLSTMEEPNKIIRRPNESIELNIAIAFFLVAIICFIVHFFFFRYSFPPNNMDEASFFSPAQSLAAKGRLSSDIHASFLPGADRYTYWMPPLYMVLLGGVFKIFGATVLNAKILSFILIGLAAFLITKLATDRYIKICLGSLFLICPFIIISSAFIRMEGLAMLLIVISILAVKFQFPDYVTGILAGLLVMTHPMLMPCSAGLALYTLRRGLKPFVVFCILALITISPYVFYILKDLELYKTQMGLQLLRKANKKIGSLKLDYIMQSVPVSLIAFSALFFLRKATELRIFLGTSLILSLLLLLKSNEYNYQIYVMPYIIAIVGLVLEEKRDGILYRYAFPLTLYGVFSLLLVAKLAKQKFRTDKPYKEMISWLSRQRNWEGKNIYVDGSPDLATFLLENRQNVERRNAVATQVADNWFLKYNYIIEVIDNEKIENKLQDQPWQNWKTKSVFTTMDSAYSVRIFSVN